MSEANISIGSRKRIPVNEILEKIEKGEPVEYDKVIVEGNLEIACRDLPEEHMDRTDTERNHGISEIVRVIESPIRITNSKMDGEVRLNNIHFRKSIDFSGTVFAFFADFRGSSYDEAATFNLSKFCMGAYFKGSLYGESAEFNNSEFYGKSSFIFSKFMGPASFKESQFDDLISFSVSIFLKNADFSKSQFNEGVNFYDLQFKGDVIFDGSLFVRFCRFQHPLFAHNASFKEGEFKAIDMADSLNFYQARFEGNVDFRKFRSSDGFCNFQSCLFDGDTDFDLASFNSCDFEGSRFCRKANFKATEFAGNGMFMHTQFYENADFREAKFGYAHFESSVFVKESNFNKSEFKKYATFEDANFGLVANFSQAQFYTLENIIFARVHFGNEPTFEQCHFYGYAYFNETDLDRYSLAISKAIFDNPINQERAFRASRIHAENQGDKDGAENNYFKEMSARRKQKSFRRYLEYVPFELIIGYGVNPYRILIWWIAVSGAFAIYYWMSQGIMGANSVWQNAYFSFLVAFTRGYGGYTPKVGFEAIVSIEIFIGLIMFGLFLTSFARKYMR